MQLIVVDWYLNTSLPHWSESSFAIAIDMNLATVNHLVLPIVASANMSNSTIEEASHWISSWRLVVIRVHAWLVPIMGRV